MREEEEAPYIAAVVGVGMAFDGVAERQNGSRVGIVDIGTPADTGTAECIGVLEHTATARLVDIGVVVGIVVVLVVDIAVLLAAADIGDVLLVETEVAGSAVVKLVDISMEMPDIAPELHVQRFALH